MFASLLRRHAHSIVLQPDVGVSVLMFNRASLTLRTFDVDIELARACVVRLACMAGLDPLADSDSLEGRRNLARMKVRVEDDVAEVLVTISASDKGPDAELRLISVNGRPVFDTSTGQLRRCPNCTVFHLAPRQTCDGCGALLVDVADDPTPGGYIGVYRVLNALGKGSMGEVFAGEHAIIGRPVAIKLLHQAWASRPGVGPHFLSEARAASRLRHPNLVEVTDFGLLSNGQPFIVMELLSGQPLSVRLKATGAMQPIVALRMAREVGLALAAAHEGGVLHNDLKPSNIMLTDGSCDEAPRLKLIDFGAASFAGSQGQTSIGTPAYMSPERARDEAIDCRSDIYAAGIVLYEMLVGKPPFQGASSLEILHAHALIPPPTVTSPFGPLSERVVKLVMRCLAKSPDRRYQTARDVVTDVERAMAALQPDVSNETMP